LNVSKSSPKCIKPCRLIVARTPPKGDAWLHEPKLDGYHLQVAKDGHRVWLYSGLDWTEVPGTPGGTLEGHSLRTAVIDGELVVPDIRGTADFTGLAGALASDEDVTARTQD
jgi:bifunctional non-homologous end joining protein LigD